MTNPPMQDSFLQSQSQSHSRPQLSTRAHSHTYDSDTDRDESALGSSAALRVKRKPPPSALSSSSSPSSTAAATTANNQRMSRYPEARPQPRHSQTLPPLQMPTQRSTQQRPQALRKLSFSERYPSPDPRDPFAPLWVLRDRERERERERGQRQQQQQQQIDDEEQGRRYHYYMIQPDSSSSSLVTTHGPRPQTRSRSRKPSQTLSQTQSDDEDVRMGERRRTLVGLRPVEGYGSDGGHRYGSSSRYTQSFGVLKTHSIEGSVHGHERGPPMNSEVTMISRQESGLTNSTVVPSPTAVLPPRPIVISSNHSNRETQTRLKHVTTRIPSHPRRDTRDNSGNGSGSGTESDTTKVPCFSGCHRVDVKVTVKGPCSDVRCDEDVLVKGDGVVSTGIQDVESTTASAHENGIVSDTEVQAAPSLSGRHPRPRTASANKLANFLKPRKLSIMSDVPLIHSDVDLLTTPTSTSPVHNKPRRNKLKSSRRTSMAESTRIRKVSISSPIRETAVWASGTGPGGKKEFVSMSEHPLHRTAVDVQVIEGGVAGDNGFVEPKVEGKNEIDWCTPQTQTVDVRPHPPPPVEHLAESRRMTVSTQDQQSVRPLSSLPPPMTSQHSETSHGHTDETHSTTFSFVHVPSPSTSPSLAHAAISGYENGTGNTRQQKIMFPSVVHTKSSTPAPISGFETDTETDRARVTVQRAKAPSKIKRILSKPVPVPPNVSSTPSGPTNVNPTMNPVTNANSNHSLNLSPPPVLQHKSKSKSFSETLVEPVTNVGLEPVPEWLLPSPTTLLHVSSLSVTAESGARVTFGSLFEHTRTVVVFIRHFWCPLCQDYMTSVVDTANRKEVVSQLFDHRGGGGDHMPNEKVKVVVIGNGSYSMIGKYKQIFGLGNAAVAGLAVEVYTDPSLAIHSALGMGKDITSHQHRHPDQHRRYSNARGRTGQALLRVQDLGVEQDGKCGPHTESEKEFTMNRRHKRGECVSMGGYVKHGLMGGFAMVVVRALKVGMPVWERGGDSAQLGGEFVFGPGMVCTYAHRMQTTKGHAPFEDVLRAAGVVVPPFHSFPTPRKSLDKDKIKIKVSQKERGKEPHYRRISATTRVDININSKDGLKSHGYSYMMSRSRSQATTDATPVGIHASSYNSSKSHSNRSHGRSNGRTSDLMSASKESVTRASHINNGKGSLETPSGRVSKPEQIPRKSLDSVIASKSRHEYDDGQRSQERRKGSGKSKERKNPQALEMDNTESKRDYCREGVNRRVEGRSHHRHPNETANVHFEIGLMQRESSQRSSNRWDEGDVNMYGRELRSQRLNQVRQPGYFTAGRLSPICASPPEETLEIHADDDIETVSDKTLVHH